MYHILAKPASADCNLACTYCYYRRVQKMYPSRGPRRMSDELLELYIRQVIEDSGHQVNFGWQGGEPLLMGVDFFKRAFDLQRKYARPGQVIQNCIQTNGTLLDERWCELLRENEVLVGLSIDGPHELHDHYRKTIDGRPSHARVMRALELMLEHGVEFNALVLLNDVNVKHPREVYHFLFRHGVRHMQFIPCVEHDGQGNVLPFSVTPEDYANFMCTVFDEWKKRHVRLVSVRMFDNILMPHLNIEPELCVFGTSCDRSLILEYNGDLYCCDHFVYPEYKLGNIFQTPIRELVQTPLFLEFKGRKLNLPRECLDCQWRIFCQGGCPKHRIVMHDDDYPSNYLCPAYKQIFEHTHEEMRRLAEQVVAENMSQAPLLDMPPAAVAPAKEPGRNDPCPCGSGLKYKHCCMKLKQH